MLIETFEAVLAQLDAQGREELDGEWMSIVEDALQRLEAIYPTLTNEGREAIDYSELPTQAAYLYAYALPRAAFTYEFLSRHRAAVGGPLFDKLHLNIVSFGGGPASELVGLIQYLENEEFGESVESIDYQIFDKDGEWADVAIAVAQNIPTEICINITYTELDLVNGDQVAEIDLSDIDLVVFSYIMSELCALDEKDAIQTNLQSALSGLVKNSKILFIESKHPAFIKYFQSCKLVPGLRQKNDNGNPVNLDLPELGATYGRFSNTFDRQPRMDGNIVSKLIIKV